MTASPAPSVQGQSTTLTAELPPNATGTVAFQDGATDLGTASLTTSDEALQFDGSSTYVDLGRALAFTKVSPFSVSFWLQSSYTGLQMVIGKGDGFLDHTAPGWTVFTAYGYLYFQLNAASVFGISELQTWDLSDYICNSEWHHVVITYNGGMSTSGVAYYIDGVAQPLGADSNDLGDYDITNDVDSTIGATPGATPDQQGFFHGALAEMDVFNTVISSADVATLYNGGAGDYGAAGVGGLIAGYHLNGAAAGAVADYSGNENDGTLGGDAAWVNGPISLSVASITTSDLALGANSITAVYSGDENYAPCTSAPIVQTIITPPTLYWNPLGDNAWSTAAANWNSSSDDTGTQEAWVPGAAAVFSTDSGTVTIADPQIEASSIEFATDGFTLVSAASSNDALAIGPDGMTIETDSGTATLIVPVVDADPSTPGNLTTTGSGVTILGAADTSSGTTTVGAEAGDDGALQLGDGTNAGSVAGDITDNATLIFDNPTVQTYAGAISGGGTVTVSTSMTLSGDNSGFTGTTMVQAGAALDLEGPLGGTLTVASGGHVTGTDSPLVAVIGGLSAGPAGTAVSFTASATDSTTAGNPSISLTWNALDPNGNTVSFSGSGTNSISFTPAIEGTYTVSVVATDDDATSAVATHTFVADNLPTLVTAAAASPATVTGTTVSLSVLGTDDLGASNLTYDWVATSLPTGAAAPTFSDNDDNSASTTVATFSQAGDYTFTATIASAGGQAITSTVNVTVSQTLSSISVIAPSLTLMPGGNEQFSAVALDQFGNPLTTQPMFTWTAVSDSINSTGDYTAPTSLGSDVVTASSGTVSGFATVSVVPTSIAISGAPTVPQLTPYMLSLASSLPTADPITSWIINWGDGSPLQTIDSSPLPTSVPHVFTAQGATPSRQPPPTLRATRTTRLPKAMRSGRPIPALPACSTARLPRIPAAAARPPEASRPWPTCPAGELSPPERTSLHRALPTRLSSPASSRMESPLALPSPLAA